MTTKPFITLNLPQRGLAAGTPIIASHDRRIMSYFKIIVLENWGRRAEQAPDELMAAVNGLEYQKLKATLDLLIPDSEEAPDE